MPKANLKTSEGIIDMLETALNDMYEDKLSIEYAGKRISACKHAIQQHALDLMKSRINNLPNKTIETIEAKKGA